MTFDCACSDSGDMRCLEHIDFSCHKPEPPHKRGECPPCWLARIRSVSLSSKATPTRGKR